MIFIDSQAIKTQEKTKWLKKYQREGTTPKKERQEGSFAFGFPGIFNTLKVLIGKHTFGFGIQEALRFCYGLI